MRISDWSSDVCSSDLNELGAPADSIFIGYFGTFVERKRPELFLESIAALIARQPGRPIYGLMFGAALDDRTQSALEKKVQMLKLGEHVRFMGWRTPGVRWIAACDLLMRSEEHTSELQSLMRISYAVFC